MATIIRLLVKGSELLNRLRQQQAGNRAGQAQRERDRKLQEQAKGKKKQQQAPAFAPDAKRRRNEPIASRRAKVPGRFVFSMLYLKSPTYTWPDGKVGQFYEPTPFKTFSGEEGGINIEDTDGLLRINRDEQVDYQTILPLSQWHNADQFLDFYNQNKIPPNGEVVALSQPPVTAWGNFNNRVPFADGQYLRMYKSMAAVHNSEAVYTYGASYATASLSLTENSPTIITDVGTPEFQTVRVEPPGQASPFTLVPFVLGPRGYGVSFSGSDIYLDVFAPGALQENASGGVGNQTRFGLYGDEASCAIVYQVGDVVKVAARVRRPGFFGEDVTQANQFMTTYFISRPELEYTITGVIRSGNTIRYKISGANWPPTSTNALDYYLLRPHSSWDTVIPEESWWTSDDGVIQGDDRGGLINSIGYSARSSWYIAPGKFGDFVAADRDYSTISTYEAGTLSGLALSKFNLSFDGDYAIRLATPSAVRLRISETSSGWNSDRPSDWREQDRDYWLWRGGLNNAGTAYVLELAEERVDTEVMAGRPSKLTFYKVEIPRDLLAPLWERTDLGFPFFGTIAYLPPSP